ERYMEFYYRNDYAEFAWFPGPPEFEPGENEDSEPWQLAGETTADGLECLGVYQIARNFSLRAARFVELLPDSAREDSVVVDFLANIMIVPARIAAGSSFGTDPDELGGNIAQ